MSLLCAPHKQGVRLAVHMAVGRVVAAGALLLRLPARAGPQVWWRPRLPVLPWAVVSAPPGLLGSSHQVLRGSLTLLADPEWPRWSSGCGSSSTLLLLTLAPLLSFSIGLHLTVCCSFLFYGCLFPLFLLSFFPVTQDLFDLNTSLCVDQTRL